MQAQQIFYPVFAMVLLTFVIGFRLLGVRFRAVREDGLSPAYFQYNRGGKPPEYMLRTEQNYANLLELPMLFYAAVLLAYVTAHTDASNILLGWLFVLSRVAHSYIHIRFNKLAWRRRSFLLGVLVLAVFWVKLFIQLIA